VKYALCVCLFFVACKAECKMGGGEEVAAVDVQCEVKSGPAVECQVKETKGTAEVEACWDFSAVCTNGATLKAERTCQKVKDGGTASVTTPKEKITLAGECDGNPVAKAENLTINGKASTPTK
jgi:hypothetical protein